MLFYWLLFFFVAFGAKAVLAFIMIFLLLPSDRSCAQCDDETLWIRSNRAGRFGSALTLGRVQWRWCPRCGWEGLARRAPQVKPGQRRQPGTIFRGRINRSSKTELET
jgi:hypothetical protein